MDMLDRAGRMKFQGQNKILAKLLSDHRAAA
jgi:hypothetical protein